MKVKTRLLQKDIEAYFEAVEDITRGRYGLTPEFMTEALVSFHKEMVKSGVTKAHYQTLVSEFTQTLRVIKSRAFALGPVLENGVNVRAACAAGIIDGEPDDVGELEPWEVVELVNELTTAINKAYEAPKK